MDNDSDYEYESANESVDESDEKVDEQKIIDKDEISGYINDSKLSIVFKNPDKFFKSEVVVYNNNSVNYCIDLFIQKLIYNIIKDKHGNEFSVSIADTINDIKKNYNKRCISCWDNLNVIVDVPTVCKKEFCKYSLRLFTESKEGKSSPIQFNCLEEVLYCRALKSLQVRHLDLKKKISKTQGVNKKLLTRIMKDIKLFEQLPLNWGSSIFVVVDETYPQYMEALITGPTDTPYENGIYMFDIFIPEQYPNIPPKVTIINNDNVRFNPNLYASGKVCLSLLGTWSGPGWDPKESSIYQVLVSIQSLILVDKPYKNEPAYYNSNDVKQIELYSQNVYHSNVKVAICEMFKKKTHFNDIIKTHLQHKHNEILNKIKYSISNFKEEQVTSQRDGGIQYSKKSMEKLLNVVETFFGI